MIKLTSVGIYKKDPKPKKHRFAVGDHEDRWFSDYDRATSRYTLHFQIDGNVYTMDMGRGDVEKLCAELTGALKL